MAFQAFWWPVAELNHGHADFQSNLLACCHLTTAKKRNSFSWFAGCASRLTEPVTEPFWSYAFSVGSIPSGINALRMPPPILGRTLYGYGRTLRRTCLPGCPDKGVLEVSLQRRPGGGYATGTAVQVSGTTGKSRP